MYRAENLSLNKIRSANTKFRQLFGFPRPQGPEANSTEAVHQEFEFLTRKVIEKLKEVQNNHHEQNVNGVVMQVKSPASEEKELLSELGEITTSIRGSPKNSAQN